MLKKFRRNDTVYSNTFSPSVRTSQGHTCSQLFIGENTNFMHVELIKLESYAYIALQDFTRKHRIPHTIKTNNTRTETSEK